MMIEYDLVIMSLCIFIPSVFALVLAGFPKGTEEYMRWWSLVGTAITFVLSAFIFIDYYQMLDGHPDKARGAGAHALDGRLSGDFFDVYAWGKIFWHG